MQYAWEQSGEANPLIVLKNGQEVIDYLGGQGAFAARDKHPLPCLLLLDLNLPVKNGLEVLRWIRAQPAVESLKVVVVSGSNHQSDIELACSLGAVDYIVKPSAPAGLLKIIKERKEIWFGKGDGP